MLAAMSPSRWAFLGRQKVESPITRDDGLECRQIGHFFLFGGRRFRMCLLVISVKEGIIGCPNLTLLIDTAL